MRKKTKSFNKANSTPAKRMLAAFAVSLVICLLLWPAAVQLFVNEYIHAEKSLVAQVFPKVAESLPLIEPRWGLLTGPFEAAVNPFHGDFMLKSNLVIIVLLACLVIFFALQDYLGNHDGTWQGPKRSKKHSGGAYLESSHKTLKQTTHGWSGEVPAKANGLIVAYFDESFRYIEYINSILLGAVGSGKTLRVLLPTVALGIACSSPIFCLDPKGEIKRHTEGFARKNGYRVIDLSFSDPLRSPETWNPLSRAMEALESEPFGMDDAIAEVATVANFVCPTPASSSNPYWTDTARSLFEGLTLYVISNPEISNNEKNLSTVGAMLTVIEEDGTTPLVRVRTLARTLPLDHPAKSKLAQTAGAPDETAESVISTLASKLNDYMDPRISKMLWKSSFSLAELCEPKTIIYVSFTGARGNYSKLVSTLVSQTISCLMQLASEQSGRLAHDCYLILEEFVQLERMPRLVGDLAIFRGCGIHVLFVVQEKAMLLAKGYSEAEVRSIFACADDTLVLSVNDVATAKELSDRVGKYWAESKSDSQSHSSRGSGFFTGSSSEGQSTGAQLVSLLPPEDLMSWDKSTGNLLLRKSGVYAFPSAFPAQTFLSKLGIGLQGPEAADFTEKPLLNTTPAPIWLPDLSVEDDEDDPTSDEAGAVIDMTSDFLRTFNPLNIH